MAIGIYEEGMVCLLGNGLANSTLELRLVTAPIIFNCIDEWAIDFVETTANNYAPQGIGYTVESDGNCLVTVDWWNPGFDPQVVQCWCWNEGIGAGDAPPETIVAAVVTINDGNGPFALAWHDLPDFDATGQCQVCVCSEEIDLCIPVGEIDSTCSVPEE